MAVTRNLTCDQGSTYLYQFYFSASKTNPVATDLTGHTFRLQVRPKAGSATLIVELSTENGRITVADNVVRLQLTATETAELKAGEYVYDLENVVGPTVTKALRGTFTVIAEVTR